MKKRIAIVGGGISGLTAAYVLHRDHSRACAVTLYEASDRFGGIIETVRQEGFTVECGPDSWVTEKPWAEELARELGLGAELLPSNDALRRTYIAQHGRLTPMPDAMRMMVPTELGPTLASSFFSTEAKQAYASEPGRAAELRASALLSRGPDADESVAAFVERHFGREVVETVAGPLLAGIFGGDIEKLSARALLGPFAAMEVQHGSLITALQQRRPAPAASVFTTLSCGLGTLVERLADALPMTSLRLQTPVIGLQPEGDRWIISTANGQHPVDAEPFDAVLLATPLDATRKLLASLSFAGAQEAASCLPDTASSSLIVAFGYAAPVAQSLQVPPGFGLLVAPSGEDRSPSLLACTFLHQKFAHRAPPGGVLLRAFFGSTAADRLSELPDTHIAAVAREQLKHLLGPLPTQADVTLVRRWPRSLPQYEVDHVTRIAHFDAALASVPGLATVGNAYRGVGLPDLVRDAAAAAKRLAPHEVQVHAP